MLLARVKGNVVSTQKNEFLRGHKLLIVHQIDTDYNEIDGIDIIVIDLVNAGIGDIVIVVQEGSAVKQILGHGNAPVHSMIVAVVDDIEVTTNSK
jgi:microcompartment protein CcmK/EutM